MKKIVPALTNAIFIGQLNTEIDQPTAQAHEKHLQSRGSNAE